MESDYQEYDSEISDKKYITNKNECTGSFSLLAEIRHFTRWLSRDMAVLDYFAGDTQHVAEELHEPLERLRLRRGNELFSDLLHALTHKRYQSSEAEYLWNEIVVHKYYMSEKLKRNVGIKVAVLDYLDNQSGQNNDFQLLPEHDLDCLLLFVNEDGLTGLYNHRYFQEELREELARCKRYNRIFSLLLIDLDHFKTYNDHFGHRKGDWLLREISAFFKRISRDADTVARYGGDEFAYILPETNKGEALQFAQRLIQAFKATGISNQIPGLIKSVSLSLGIATYPDNALGAEELIEITDQALYKAKHAGRDCIKQAKSKPMPLNN